ncbi:MAG: PTS galactitol transporter subunit IIC [Anaerostipes sp.]|jgi:PTS system galactitol-specific IIC component|nr:PTS galactitol transporter subunit IIC [Anaerostipes sp.]MDD3747548.1 PTS galactitol transporter subunit IIC [Anaerostipes sp.]
MFILNFILDCGASVMLPIIIFILGVIMGAGVSKAFKSGITIGIGFTGIGLVTGLLSDQLGPVAQQMTERLGLHMDIIDIGWPAMSSITWAWSAAGLMIPICLIVNIVLLALKLTKTMNVDIWNYWQFAFVGAAVSVVTGSIPIGLVAGALISALALILADFTQPYIEKFFNMPGISFPHLTALGCLPVVYPLVWILDRIPGINKIDINADSLRKKFGIFGEPMMMGLIIGFILAVLAGSKPQVILQTGIGLAAVMYLMPKMVACLMEGLMPISQAAQELMSKRFQGREIFIGLDAAVSLGDPSVIAVGLVLVPITIALAVIMPGNRILPFADLAVIPYIVCLFTAMCRGNIFRALLVGTVVMALVLLMASTLGPIETPLAVAAGVKIPSGATLIGNLDRANILTWLFIKISSLF